MMKTKLCGATSSGLLFTAVALMLSACEGTKVCTTQVVYALQVTTGSGADGQSAVGGAGGQAAGGAGNETPQDGECEVIVTAVGQGSEQQLECMGSGVNCSCYGLPEATGSYEVTASFHGIEESRQVQISADECHSIPEELSFFEELSGMDEERAKIDQEVQKLKELATAGSCTSASDCSTVGVGSKACGGHWSWLVYSSADADATAVEELASQIEEDERAYNKKYGVISDCAYAVEPVPACEEGSCVATSED